MNVKTILFDILNLINPNKIYKFRRQTNSFEPNVSNTIVEYGIQRFQPQPSGTVIRIEQKNDLPQNYRQNLITTTRRNNSGNIHQINKITPINGEKLKAPNPPFVQTTVENRFKMNKTQQQQQRINQTTTIFSPLVTTNNSINNSLNNEIQAIQNIIIDPDSIQLPLGYDNYMENVSFNTFLKVFF